MKLKFWDSFGAEETATVLSRFEDHEGEWYYVVPPSTAAMYDRTPRVICPDNVIGLDLTDEITGVNEAIYSLLSQANEIAYENGLEDLQDAILEAIEAI